MSVKPGLTTVIIGLAVKPSICPLNLVYVMKLRITIEKPSICPLNLVYVR